MELPQVPRIWGMSAMKNWGFATEIMEQSIQIMASSPSSTMGELFTKDIGMMII
jgi:hypothetical protein